IYLEWLHDDGMPSAARLGAPFIATSSLTKAYGLDWLRAGWVLAPPDVAERIRRVQDLFSGHIAQPTQRLAAKALDRAAALLAPLHGLVGRNRNLVDRFVNAHERLSWVRPVAGTVGFVHLRGGSVDELVERLETRYDTTVAPGQFFGMPTWFRIGFGMETAVLEEGLARLAAALAKWGPGAASGSRRPVCLATQHAGAAPARCCMAGAAPRCREHSASREPGRVSRPAPSWRGGSSGSPGEAAGAG